MEISQKQLKKKKRNVVVVGLKMRPASREVLTWALAKFTTPGDRVVALHIAMQPQSSSFSSGAYAQPYADRNVGNIFDSVMGVYDGFCRAKQIDLELKVVSSVSSLQRTLTEEVRGYNAIKLLLGTSDPELPTDDFSFALAKYCSKHLPGTCLVLVTQHGKVVFEQAGALTLGDKRAGKNTSRQWIMKGSSAGHNQHSNARKKFESQDHAGANGKYCNRCHGKRSLDSPHHVLHPFKYVPPQVKALQRCDVKFERLSFMSTSKDSRLKHHVPPSNGFGSSTPAEIYGFISGPLDNRLVLGKHRNLLDSKQCLQKCTAVPSELQKCVTISSCSPGWPLVKTGWNSVNRLPNCSLGQEVASDASTPCENLLNSLEVTTFQSPVDTKRGDSNGIPQGWPFLHQSRAARKSETTHAKAHRMSVIEWVLQLPERPKTLLEQQSGLMKHKPSFCSTTSDRKTGSEICDARVKDQQDADLVSSTEVQKSLLEKCNHICKSKACVVFQIAELETATNHFSKDNIVGKGGCSQVYRGVLSDGQVVAVKCLDMSLGSDSENEFLTEIEIVNGLEHHHIINLLGYCVNNKQRYLLVYNFASEGNLEQKLHNADDNAVLSWIARFKIAIGVGEALEYLHSSVKPVIHRDVKSSNILLQSDLSPQLTDFGLSKWAPVSSTFLTCSDVVGTFGYIAPEYFMFGKVSHKTDVYSYGVVLLELVSGKHPIDNVGLQGQENLILWARPLLEDESRYDEIVDWKLRRDYDGEQLKSMLTAASLCLQHSPHLRPSMSEILEVLRGHNVDLDLRQDSMSRGNEECYVLPAHGDHDIRRHLSLALYGLDDDDIASQATIDATVNSNNLIKEYLRHRFSRSNSFE